MKIILLGPPGAGKGSLAKELNRKTNVAHISTGDILREEMKNESEAGLEAKKFIESGDLVPDELVTKLVNNKFANDDSLSNGYMLDGFPRTRKQAEDLDDILIKTEKPYDFAFYMESTIPIIIKRICGRRVCKKCGELFHITNKPPQQEGICDLCGGELYQRPDDNEETIKNRMEVYLKSTMPIVDYYQERGKLKKIDGDKETEDLVEIVHKVFNE